MRVISAAVQIGSRISMSVCDTILSVVWAAAWTDAVVIAAANPSEAALATRLRKLDIEQPFS